jgi:hypothetical protein
MTDFTVRLLLSIDFLTLGVWLGSGVYFHTVIRPYLSCNQSSSGKGWDWSPLLTPIKRLLILQLTMCGVLLGTSFSRTVLLPFPWYFSVTNTLVFSIRLAMLVGALTVSTWIIPRLQNLVTRTTNDSRSGEKDLKRLAQYGSLFLLLDLTILALCALSIVLLVQFG